MMKTWRIFGWLFLGLGGILALVLSFQRSNLKSWVMVIAEVISAAGFLMLLVPGLKRVTEYLARKSEVVENNPQNDKPVILAVGFVIILTGICFMVWPPFEGSFRSMVARGTAIIILGIIIVLISRMKSLYKFIKNDVPKGYKKKLLFLIILAICITGYLIFLAHFVGFSTIRRLMF